MTMDVSTARTVVVVGTSIGVFVWFLGLRAYGKLLAEPSRYRKRVPVRSAGPEAFAEVLRWAVGEGRQIIERGEQHVKVRAAAQQMELLLLEDAAGPVLEIRADLSALKRKFTIGFGLVVFLVAPALLTGLFIGLYMYAAPSSNPGIRGQVFQVFQSIHALWPPFLSGQYRSLRRRLLDPVGDTVATLIDVGIAAGEGS